MLFVFVCVEKQAKGKRRNAFGRNKDRRFSSTRNSVQDESDDSCQIGGEKRSGRSNKKKKRGHKTTTEERRMDVMGGRAKKRETKDNKSSLFPLCLSVSLSLCVCGLCPALIRLCANFVCLTAALSQESLPYQLLIVVQWTTMAVTGNGKFGFDSGEGASKTATTAKVGSRRANCPISTLKMVRQRQEVATLTDTTIC